MPGKEAKMVTRWSIGVMILVALFTAIINGAVAIFFFGEKIEAKADRDAVPTRIEFQELRQDFMDYCDLVATHEAPSLVTFQELESRFEGHCVRQAGWTGEVNSTLKGIQRQLDRIEKHLNGGEP